MCPAYVPHVHQSYHTNQVNQPGHPELSFCLSVSCRKQPDYGAVFSPGATGTDATAAGAGAGAASVAFESGLSLLLSSGDGGGSGAKRGGGSSVPVAGMNLTIYLPNR